eukprot:gene127-3518_t
MSQGQPTNIEVVCLKFLVRRDVFFMSCAQTTLYNLPRLSERAARSIVIGNNIKIDCRKSGKAADKQMIPVRRVWTQPQLNHEHVFMTDTSSVINMANVVAGVSVLAFPFIFAKCGLVLGIVLSYLLCKLNIHSCELLLMAAVMTQTQTYEDLVVKYNAMKMYATNIPDHLGKNSISGQLFGMIVAFYLVAADLITRVLVALNLVTLTESSRGWVMVIVAIFWVFPACMGRSVHTLAKLMALSFTYDTICWYTWLHSNPRTCIRRTAVIVYDYEKSSESQSYTYEGQLNTTDVLYRGLSLDLIFYLIVEIGISGFFAFYDIEIDGNALNDLKSPFVQAAFSLSILVSFPLIVYPCRESLYLAMFQPPKDRDVTPAQDSELPPSSRTPQRSITGSMPTIIFLLITFAVVFVALAGALIIPAIQTVLTIVGATAGTVVSFIFPAWIYLQGLEDVALPQNQPGGIRLPIAFSTTAATVSVSAERFTNDTKLNPLMSTEKQNWYEKEKLSTLKFNINTPASTHVRNISDKLVLRNKTELGVDPQQEQVRDDSSEATQPSFDKHMQLGDENEDKEDIMIQNRRIELLKQQLKEANERAEHDLGVFQQELFTSARATTNPISDAPKTNHGGF